MMKEKEESAKFINFFDRKSKLSDTPNVGSVEGKDSSDVLNGRHPVNNELKEHHPTIASNIGQGLILRGSKRHETVYRTRETDNNTDAKINRRVVCSVVNGFLC